MYIYSIPKHIYKFNIAGCNGGVMVIGLLLQVKDKDHCSAMSYTAFFFQYTMFYKNKTSSTQSCGLPPFFFI